MVTLSDKQLREFAECFRPEKKETPTIKINATVRSIDTTGQDPVYYVDFDGAEGIESCPVSSTLGDEVLNTDDRVVVLVDNREGTIVGNLTKPVDVVLIENLEENYSTTEEVQRMIEEGSDNGYQIIEWARSSSESIAPSSGWSTTMPELTTSYPYLWQRLVTVTGDTRTVTVSPQRATTMDGLYVFMNQARNGSATVINGGSIDTSTLYLGRIQNGNGNYAEIKNTGMELYKEYSRTALFSEGEILLDEDTDGETLIRMGSSGIIYGSNTLLGIKGSRGLILSGGSYGVIVATGLEVESDLSVDNNLYIEGATRVGGSIAPNVADGASLGTTSLPWHNVVAANALGLTSEPKSGSQTYDAIWHKTDAGNYWLYRPSSARKWKNSIKDIEDEEINPRRLYDLPVRQFRWNDVDAFDDEIDIGFIADEVAEIYPRAASFDMDDDGNEFACDWNHRRLLPAMLKLIQNQHKEIEELKEAIQND